jgi:hypothetical protein
MLFREDTIFPKFVFTKSSETIIDISLSNWPSLFLVNQPILKSDFTRDP